MTKEELIKLKEDIAKLSESDKKQRDIYLRKLATGEFQGPPVGYASIDKTCLKYYAEDKFNLDLPNELFYKSLQRMNKNNMDTTAIEYFFAKIQYKKYFENVHSLIKAMYNSGVRDGNYVGICLAGIPESMYAVGALSYLGAVGVFFPPYLDPNAMINDIKFGNTKILILMDYFYNDEKYKDIFNKLIEKSTIEKVVIVPTLNSSFLKKLQKKNELPNSKFIYYDDFIDASKSEVMPEIAKYYPDKPLAVVYSSGSTGLLKGTLLSNDAFVNSAASYEAFGFNLSPGQVVYHVIPPFTSTGLIADATTALYYGCTLYQNPTFDPIVFSKNLGIHRINWGIATTALFSGLNELEKSKLFVLLTKLGVLNYKKLSNAYIGGTVSTKHDRERLNRSLARVGASAKILSSYGTSENGSIVSAELPDAVCTIYPEKSVGIPLPGVTVMAVDENGNELPTGTRGEISVNTNSGMIGYYNRPNLSNGFFMDGGKKFNHTHDIGCTTQEGFVIYFGRQNDTSTVNSTVFYNFDVKDAIFKNPNVCDCDVLTNCEGLYCAHILFNDGVSNIDEEIINIQRTIYETFDSIDYVPQFFKVRDSFPMAGSTKRDYPKLKKETDGFVKYEFTREKQYIKNK